MSDENDPTNDTKSINHVEGTRDDLPPVPSVPKPILTGPQLFDAIERLPTSRSVLDFMDAHGDDFRALDAINTHDANDLASHAEKRHDALKAAEMFTPPAPSTRRLFKFNWNAGRGVWMHDATGVSVCHWTDEADYEKIVAAARRALSAHSHSIGAHHIPSAGIDVEFVMATHVPKPKPPTHEPTNRFSFTR